jgi:hypothetical protein
VGGDAEDVHAAGGVLDDEERVEPVQGDGVEVEQVAGEYRVRLGPQELGPRWPGSARRWVDAGAVQDVPDGGGADLVAEAGEFAVDASISPGGVLGGQTDDQGTQAGGDGRSTGPDGLGGAAAGDELAVPAQDGGRGDEQPEASADREQSGEGGDQGAVGPRYSRAWRAPLEHGELVAQDQDLDVLGGVGSGAQHDPPRSLANIW